MFSAPASVQATPGTPSAIAVGDLNRDGKPDAVTADSSAGGSTVTVLLGDGALGWSSATDVSLGDGRGPKAIVINDFNGDGWLDVVTANAGWAGNSSGSISRLYGGASGLGAATTTGLSSGTTGIDSGDFDEDGLPEIGASINESGSGSIAVLANQPGGFATVYSRALAVPARSIGASDVNLDGHLDLTALVRWQETPYAGGLQVHLGKGRLTGPDPFDYWNTETGGGTEPNSLTFATTTSDGRPGFISGESGFANISNPQPGVTPPYNNYISIFRNRGGNTPWSTASAFLGLPTTSVAGEDFSGDGNLDYVGTGPPTAVTNVGVRNIGYSSGNGAGSVISGTREYLLVSGLQRIAAGDFDQDGRPDLVGSITGGVTILHNTGGVAATGAGRAVISELRLAGAGGASDQYIQLTNRSMTATLPLGGWSLKFSDGRTLRIRTGTVLPRGGRLLLAAPPSLNSLASYGAQDAVLPYAPVPSNGGVALIGPTGATIDAAGMAGAPAGFVEGAGITPVAELGIRTYVRRFSAGLPQDTDNNAADFIAVDTAANGTTAALLGAPRPDGASSPAARNDFLQASLVDPSVSATAAPNRVLTTSGAQTTAITINRKITNCSGPGRGGTGVCVNAPASSNVTATRLRFRITDLSTYGTGPGAILKATASSDAVYGAISVKGLPLDAPSVPGNGGVNSSLTATALLPSGGLAPGASINVAFTFTVVRGGSFRFAFNTEDDLVAEEPAGVEPPEPAIPALTPDPQPTPEVADPGAQANEVTGVVPGPASAAAPLPVGAAAPACVSVNTATATKPKTSSKTRKATLKTKKKKSKKKRKPTTTTSSCLANTPAATKPSGKTKSRGKTRAAKHGAQ